MTTAVQLAQSVAPGVSLGFKNRVINGNMTIDQRNAGASVTPANGAYTLDRWRIVCTQASKFTVQQNAGSVATPAGFINYLGVTSSSAYTVGAAETFAVRQIIEGLNVADLGWGAAGASTVTLSFWVRSSLTGTFGGSLYNDNGDYSYPYSYTINSANTWEQKSITIAGPTSGTWLKTNGGGIYVGFSLGTGSTYSGAAGSWYGNYYNSCTGATSVVGTNGATFYITGVQLEVGTAATPFEFRDYGRELMMCQRYYYRTTAGAADNLFGIGSTVSTTGCLVSVPFPVTMRVAPSALETTGTSSDYDLRSNVPYTVSSGPTFGAATTNAASISAVSSGMTAGYVAAFRASVTGAYLGWSAEL